MKRLFLFLIAAASTASLWASVPRAEYPRPQFQREQWCNLNGEWSFAIDNERAGEAQGWTCATSLEDKIIVPFGTRKLSFGCRTHGLHVLRLVPALCGGAVFVERQENSPQFRRGRLQVFRIYRRRACRIACRRYFVVFVRHHAVCGSRS